MRFLLQLLKRYIPSTLWNAVRGFYRNPKYFGVRYRCPCCGAFLRTFLSSGERSQVFESIQIVGGGFRENVFCPACYSKDRTRLLYLFLKNKTDLFVRPHRVLHVAPEVDLRSKLDSLHIDYVTTDFSRKDVSLQMDIREIPLPEDSFDVIICNHVLEHIEDDMRAMKELHRVLKPSGWAVLQVPISPSLKATFEDPTIVSPDDRFRCFGQRDHVRVYGADYPDRLCRAGFEVFPFSWKNELTLFGGSKNRYGLIEDEVVFFCRKDTRTC